MHRCLYSGGIGGTMGFDTIIRNGTIVTATDTYAADIGITSGQITAIGKDLPIDNAAKCGCRTRFRWQLTPCRPSWDTEKRRPGPYDAAFIDRA